MDKKGFYDLLDSSFLVIVEGQRAIAEIGQIKKRMRNRICVISVQVSNATRARQSCCLVQRSPVRLAFQRAELPKKKITIEDSIRNHFGDRRITPAAQEPQGILVIL